MNRFIHSSLFFLSWLATSVGLNSAVVGQDADAHYILTVGDVVFVQVFGQEDLQTEQEISNRGSINMGLIGPVDIAFMSVEAAEETIRQAYIDQQFLRNPQVIIGVQQYSAKMVSVLGQVNQPGSIQLNQDASSRNSMSIARVISMVGGFRGIAKKDSVRVVRKTSSGQEETLVVDLSNIGRGRSAGDGSVDFLVLANDVIYVPERIF